MYKFEEHTADVRIKVEANSLEELFSESAKAISDFMVEIEKVEPKEKKVIELESEDLLDLYDKFLTELLFYFDSEGFIWRDAKVEIKKNGKYKLRAEIFGEKYDVEKHGYEGYIKAITFHEMEIGEENGKWKGKFVIDI